jgi:hypothetical protein
MAKTASKSKRAPSSGKKKPRRSGAKKPKARKSVGSKRVVDPLPGPGPFEL